MTAFVAMLLLLGQGAQPALPSAEARPVGSVGQDYRIGPGDILRITVYGYDDLTQTVVVQPTGGFVFPLIGVVPASESTPGDVERKLAARLAKGLIRDPKVTVVVQDYRSKVVFALGEVTRPGTYPLAGETTLVELLSRAGPLSPTAASEVIVVRPAVPTNKPVLPTDVQAPGAPGAPPSAEILRVELRDLQEGRFQKNLVLKPNDTIFVPQAAKVFVSGEVKNAGAFPFSNGLTVRQAVSLAGGFTPEASTGGVRIVRQVDGRPVTAKVKLDDPLRPGDTIVVKTRLF
jgi:polysaccharide biosynthesis/export protein